MSAVLVTRPGEQGQALCSQLQDCGYKAIYHPLIKIIPNKNSQLDLTNNRLNYDIIIAVSQHAVTAAGKLMIISQQSWPQSVHYFAIGEKTAHYLHKETQQCVHFPEYSDSEHFLALPQLQQILDKKVLILRGQNGRELIRDTLVLRGALVDYAETYSRQRIVYEPSVILKQWQQLNIDKIVVTSSEQLHYLCEPLNHQQLAWLHQQQLFVPSQRIATQAIQQGFTRVRCTGSASNQALLAALQP